MQVTGVQPIGGARYVALQPVVVETRQPPSATAQEAGPAAAQARLAEAETVVFPRRGASIDHRPDELKQAKAAAKYRENQRVDGTLERERRPRR